MAYTLNAITGKLDYYQPVVPPSGISGGQIIYNNSGVFDGIPGSAVNAGSGNISLSSDIAFQAGNSIYGLETLNFSASGNNNIVDVSNIYFDGIGGGIQNFGDSSALFGAILDGNSGTLTGYAAIGSILNYLDDGSGNGGITGTLHFGSLSGGQIDAAVINGTAVNSTGDITATNNIGGNGIRLGNIAQGADYTASITDYLITMDASTGAHTITLPVIGTLGAGKMYRIVKTDSTANAVILARSSSNTINGGTSYSLTKKNQYVDIQAVGSNWQITSLGYLDNTVNSVALTNQNADITATNIVGGNTAGTYQLNYVLQDTTADVTAGTVTLTIGWTDGAGVTTFGDTQLLTGVGRKSGLITMQLASGNITYAISHTGGYGTSKYALYLTLEKLS